MLEFCADEVAAGGSATAHGLKGQVWEEGLQLVLCLKMIHKPDLRETVTEYGEWQKKKYQNHAKRSKASVPRFEIEV